MPEQRNESSAANREEKPCAALMESASGVSGSGAGSDRSAASAQILESLREVRDYLRKFETVVVVHPDDLTDELRRAIEATPLATLRESRHIVPGKLLVLHPGLIEDLCGR